MRISASIYSSKQKKIQDSIEELDALNVDMIHIDFNDKKSDEKIIFSDIKKIRELSEIPIDLHIISENPSNYFHYITKHKLEYVTFQYEIIKEELIIPNGSDTKYGIAITSETSISVFNKFENKCHFILLMTTTPGESGGKFNKINFKKIREFRKSYPHRNIHIDGGIDDELGFIMRILGVHASVSGSYLMNNKNTAAALFKLKSSVVHSEYVLKDFKIDLSESPVLNIKDASLKKVLETIENYNLGFVMFINERGEFCGLISNADIRKVLINNFENFNTLSINKVINNNPITIYENNTISDMLKIIQNNEFIISFMPIIDNKKKLKGCITFLDLIVSES